MNFNQVLAQLDPSYSLKMHHWREEVQSKYDIEGFRASEARHLQQSRSQNEDQRLSRKINHDRDMESLRSDREMARDRYSADREDQRLNQRFNHDREMEQRNHENRLLQIEENLRQSVIKAGFDSGILLIQKIADQDAQRRELINKSFDIQSQLRGKIFEMLAGAVLQDALAEKQHKRELEKMNLQGNLNRAERYIASAEAYWAKVYETSGQQATEQEMDRLARQWHEI